MLYCMKLQTSETWYCVVLSTGGAQTTSDGSCTQEQYSVPGGGVINRVESTWLENFQGGEASQSAAWLCADQIAKQQWKYTHHNPASSVCVTACWARFTNIHSVTINCNKIWVLNQKESKDWKIQTPLKRYKDTNKTVKIIHNEWKKTGFYNNWHTDQGDNIYDNQNVDKGTKTILGFIGRGFSDVTQHS